MRKFKIDFIFDDIHIGENAIEFSCYASDSKLKFSYYHDQDCCENVYADFGALNDTGFEKFIIEYINKERSRYFDPSIDIEFVEDYGFRINGYGVPCYNSQNGYYNDNLELIIETYHKGALVSNFIFDCDKKDEIY